MKMAELRCKNCGATLASENVVLRLAMAKCNHCGTVFSLTDLPTPEQGGQAGPQERLKVPMPSSIRVEELGNSLEITRRWYNHGFLFLAFFCVFWNGFMVVWHGISLSQGMWFMSLFGLLHTAVGVGLAYFTVAGFLNRTVIRARRGTIEITSGPVPWRGNKTISTDNLRQLYCQEQTRRTKNGTQQSYQVHAVIEGNVKQTLLKGLGTADQALYIEQRLEQFLDIEDRSVRGEIPR